MPIGDFQAELVSQVCARQAFMFFRSTEVRSLSVLRSGVADATPPRRALTEAVGPCRASNARDILPFPNSHHLVTAETMVEMWINGNARNPVSSLTSPQLLDSRGTLHLHSPAHSNYIRSGARLLPDKGPCKLARLYICRDFRSGQRKAQTTLKDHCGLLIPESPIIW